MAEEEFFRHQMEIVFETQRNKRRGRDSIVYENNIIPLTVRAMDARLQRMLRIEHNYSFLVSLPRWREIMATSFEGRKTDHEICEVVIPAAEKYLSPYTYNNRKGKGSLSAINQVIDNICAVSQGYTSPCRCVKLDFKGYFPNALWNYAEKVMCEMLDKAELDDERLNYLKWLTMIAIHCNPTAHCTLRTPRYLWHENIDSEKSLFNKPEGVGAAIGRLIWQTAMGLYINDIVNWLNNDCLIPTVCFVDDLVLTVEERRHEYMLSLIPELRRRLLERNIRLNEKKFYDQPYQNGLEFLGCHIKPYRVHLNNNTYERAIAKIHELNHSRYKDIDSMMCSFNSYSGMLKYKADKGRLLKLKDTMLPEWWRWFEFDAERMCLVCKKGYSINERLNTKYNLKIKKYETIRNSKPAQRAAHPNRQSEKSVG